MKFNPLPRIENILVFNIQISSIGMMAVAEN